MSMELVPRNVANPELLSVARRALAEAVNPAEFARLETAAEVLRVAAKAAALPPPAINDWTRYKSDCERAGAAAVKQLQANGQLAGQGRPKKTSEARRFSELGITWQQVAEWDAISQLAEDELDEMFEKANKRGKALSHQALVKKGAAKKTRERRAASRSARVLPNAMDLREGDAREQLADIPDGSVALVLTDPPYGDEAEPLYAWLGEWSARVLIPGGSLICYTGQSRLDRDMRLLGEHLRYWWLLAMLHHQSQRLPGKFVIAEFKPVLWYVKQRRRGRTLVNDILRSPAKDKSGHDWAQGEGGVTLLIDQLTEPGELVADPFAGTGRWGEITTAKGRRWVGADIGDGGEGAVAA